MLASAKRAGLELQAEAGEDRARGLDQRVELGAGVGRGGF